MKNNYILSYLGGMHGEFLASLISNDENFYGGNVSDNKKTNRYHYEDVTYKHGLSRFKTVFNELNYPGTPVSVVSNETKDLIATEFNEKNLILLTHIYKDPSIFGIENQIPVRLYCGEEYIKLVILLALIKSWTSEWKIEPYEINYFFGNTNLNNFQLKFKDKIEQNKKCYGFERLLLSKKIFSYDFRLFFFRYLAIYKEANRIAMNQLDPQWKYINVENLIYKTDKVMHEWKKLFNLKQDLPADEILKYHEKNLSLINDIFGKKYLNFDHNLIKEIKNYVNFVCPDNIFNL